MQTKTLLAALGFGLALLGGCAPSAPAPETPRAMATVSVEAPAPESDLPPLTKHYCFQRVGQIKSDPARGETCNMHATGSRVPTPNLARAERNMADVHISSPSLEAIGLKSFTFSANQGEGAVPKFLTGVYVMDQTLTYGVEREDIADNIASGSAIASKNSMLTQNAPDSAVLREGVAGQLDLTGYEIASAVLTISVAEDVPLEQDAFERETAASARMVTGQQYIQGTLNISLIPMGSTGEQFGPTIFEFATTLDWGYLE